MESEKETALPSNVTTFRQLGVKPWLVTALKAVGITRPTPVQIACIPPVANCKNVIASAETGTGKTAAFVLPILQALADDPYGVCAVVVTPTRELAFQISQQVTALGARIAVRQYALVGGVHEITQAIALKARPHVVVATPGRLALMVSKGFVDLSRVRFLVLDEADRLLDATYLSDLKTILDACAAPSRQTLMFSATMTPTMELLQSNVMDSESETFRFDSRENVFKTVDALQQYYIFVPVNLKECYLVHLLKVLYSKATVIIFVSRCETAELLLNLLNLLGMKKVTAMHSDMKQTQRIDALQKFKSGKVRALIATDVASRGLDIPTCELVINYDLPRCIATYVHRVGRTARAGRSGRAISLVGQSDVALLHAVEEKIGRKVDEHAKMVDDDVLAHLSATLKAKQIANLQLHDNGFMERNHAKRAEARDAAKNRKRKRKRNQLENGQEANKRGRDMKGGITSSIEDR